MYVCVYVYVCIYWTTKPSRDRQAQLRLVLASSWLFLNLSLGMFVNAMHILKNPAPQGAQAACVGSQHGQNGPQQTVVGPNPYLEAYSPLSKGSFVRGQGPVQPKEAVALIAHH